MNKRVRREIFSGGETLYMDVATIRTKVRDWVRLHGLLPRGANILAACSGGPDSLALVDLLFEYQQAGEIELVVVHFNHGLRGDASDQDAEFVRQFCIERGLTCFSGSADLPEMLRAQGGSLEELARHLRYRYLRQVAAKLGGGWIATGHHRDDQAETVLLNLLRGSGGRGLGAMLPLNGDVVRPLLCLTRSEVEAYCRQRNLQPRTDASNADVDFLRNRLRHELLPALKKRYNPGLTETLCRTASILAEEQDFLRCQAQGLVSGMVEKFAGGCRIDAEAFSCLHVAMQRELLRLLLEQLRGDAKGIGFVHIEQIRRLYLRQDGSRRIDLPGGWQARRTYRQMFLERKGCECTDPGPARALSILQPLLLRCPGETEVPDCGVVIRCTRLAAGEPPPTDLGPDKAVFDCAALRFPLQVRRRSPGDLFHPLGAPGSRKLKKLLIDLKVPLNERDRLPLVCDEGGILWVAGLRRAERGRLNEGSKDLLVIEIEMERTRIDNT